MNSFLKQLTSLFIILSLIATMPIEVFATNLYIESPLSEANQRMVNENEANIEYSLLMTAFKHNSLSRSLSNRETTTTYPDYYAGAYIDEDGKLVVLTTTLSEVVDDIRNVTHNQSINIMLAENSYNELLSIKEYIEDKYIAYHSLYSNNIEVADNNLIKTVINFTGVGISERKNKVVVSLKNIDTNSIALFEKYFFSSDMIYYEQSETTIEESTPLYCGSAIYTVNGAGSIGFRCTLKIGNRYLRGFVTAGHVTGNAQYTNIYSASGLDESTKIGTLEIQKYDDGGNVDMAFVSIDENDYSVVAQTNGGILLGENYFTSIAEGTTIYMTGQHSNHSVGEIENNSYSHITEYNKLLTDCIKSDYSCQSGDSGGVVYSYINGSYCIVGIHHGQKTEWLISKKAITVKASNIYAMGALYAYNY